MAAAQGAKVQFISEDRAGEGVFLRLRVGENLVATRLAEHSRFGMLASGGLRAAAAKVAAAVGVDRARLRSYADELSGGNQQKLAFGRSLGGDEPGVLLMNEPTRGVDVGARAEIYRLIRQFCDRGYCLVMASSDIEEVLGMADVIVSMYRGRQVATYRRGEADVHRVLGRHHPPGRRGMSDVSLRSRFRLGGMRARQWVLLVRIVAGGAIAFFALSTPGFTSPLSINSLLNAISFIGCVAVGMTFITITGNIMSLALGATVSASALVFLASLSLGVFPAFLVAVLFGIVITAVQGALVGYIRANPLLVSIAASRC